MIELPKGNSNKEKHRFTEEQLQILAEVFADEILKSIEKEKRFETQRLL